MHRLHRSHPVINFMLHAIIGAGLQHVLQICLMTELERKPKPGRMPEKLNSIMNLTQNWENRMDGAAEPSRSWTRQPRFMKAQKNLLWLIFTAFILGGCASTPTAALQSVAARSGLQESVEQSQHFSHRLFRNDRPLQQGALNVYLEGDGLPWVFRYFIVDDPTPRWPMMLHLMGVDESAAVYIGRPCYNGFSKSPGCTPDLWTSARYSARVVKSMVDMVRLEARRRGATSINLFGHSGGGALALLMAENLPATKTLVTVAGNIDVEGWTDLHSYSPLLDSLNPVTRPALDESIVQVHLLGAEDENIPPTLARKWIWEQPNSYGVEYQNYTHGCCWKPEWRRLLKQIARGDLPLQFSTNPFKLPERRFLFAKTEASG